MVWLRFLLSAAVVVYAAIKLAEYGDIIAVRTKLGGLFVGTIFLAGATSLPELIASISAFQAGFPNLAAGNFFGSNMVNMMLLAIVDLINYQLPLLRRVAISHALTAALTTILMLVAIISIMDEVDLKIGWVGLDSLVIIGLYFGGIWLIQQESKGPGEQQAPAPEPADDFPSLRRGMIGFGITAVVLVLIVPVLVSASTEIAEITGLGTGFVGTALLSLVTSLPELLAALAAMRMNAFDMAVGNLFGSSVFNMLGLGIADFFYLDGRFLGAIDENFVLVGLLGLLLTNMALVGNLARVERKFLFIELDTIATIIVYLLGMYLLFIRGIGA
ncbi:sodium:calcium antiporter [Candidatus Leptofilum sp.]|uniref:sodium:calcium antiporter n=1 Tax=Candidatus Leptofilum sp. TaxID=3241576 RepID=UPI003B5CF987